MSGRESDGINRANFGYGRSNPPYFVGYPYPSSSFLEAPHPMNLGQSHYHSQMYQNPTMPDFQRVPNVSPWQCDMNGIPVRVEYVPFPVYAGNVSSTSETSAVQRPLSVDDEPSTSKGRRHEDKKGDDKEYKRKEKEKSRKRKRKRSRSRSSSVEGEKRVKARTLGELVEQTKERTVKEERKKKDEPKPPSPPSPPQKFKDIDSLPRLTEEDMAEEIILDYDAPFDPHSLQKLDHPSATTIECSSYYASKMGSVCSTPLLKNIVSEFDSHVLETLRNGKARQQVVPRAPTPPMHGKCKCGHHAGEDSSSLSESSDDEDVGDDVARMSYKSRNLYMQRKEVERKQNHPIRLHRDLCFNEPGMANDGPVCRCSERARLEGLRHNRFPGEDPIDMCDPDSNNADRLYHYVLKINKSSEVGGRRSRIYHESVAYYFEGYSLLFHRPAPDSLPRNPSSRWTTEIDFELVNEPVPACFTVAELEMFNSYIFDHLLEFVDASRVPASAALQGGDTKSCPLYHIMPRFVAKAGSKLTLLPMSVVLIHLTSEFQPYTKGADIMTMSDERFQRFNYNEKHQLVVCPDRKPCALRIDGFDRQESPASRYPMIIHHTTKPSAYVNVCSTDLEVLQKRYAKAKHLYGTKTNFVAAEKTQLDNMQREIDDIRKRNADSRAAEVKLPAEWFHRTGLYTDIVPMSLTLLLAVNHVRLHWSFSILEDCLGYHFRNRSLLELALTHPSFKDNHGTNSDHAKNTLMNCGIRKRYETADDKKKGKGVQSLNTIMRIAACSRETTSSVPHNERLEYLGDAVVQMVVSNHLFFLLPDHNEGGLSTYRSALVQNRNLASLAMNIRLHDWLMFDHGADLCHEAKFRHALANSFEALMAAVYLDDGIDSCDRIFSSAMFGDYADSKARWDNVLDHELKKGYPDGDRHLIKDVPKLQKFVDLEESLGIQFKHIRILAKAFTKRYIPMNDLTRGHNERLEWFGDTVLQLIVSDYLYRHFPNHDEGPLTLLRTCLVSNKAQSYVCDDLALADYTVKDPNQREAPELQVKDKGDLVESLIGALYVDRGWVFCKTFVKVCFIPRLKHSIKSNKWNDSKSQLQQACLALRSADAKEPEVPTYRTFHEEGPTNMRIYKVAVYFRKTKLAEGCAGRIHEAEMQAARTALVDWKHMFPSFDKKAPSRRISVRAPPPHDQRGSIPSLMSIDLDLSRSRSAMSTSYGKGESGSSLANHLHPRPSGPSPLMDICLPPPNHFPLPTQFMQFKVPAPPYHVPR